MTGRIIQLHDDLHREIQALLPWYLRGSLNEMDLAKVDRHLSGCSACQAELRAERRLDDEIAGLPADDLSPFAANVEQGWAAMRREIENSPSKRPFALRRGMFIRLARSLSGQWRGDAPWLRWAVVGQFCALVVIGALVLPMAAPNRYHALGAVPAAPAANIVVIFRPDTRERDLREMLKASNARLVDGPTAADAYMLHVPTAQRAAVLAMLRKRAQIVLVEPVDDGETP
jgi:anti-sigma factor RsiW